MSFDGRAALLLFVGITACVAPFEGEQLTSELDQQRSPIVGGEVEPGFPLVGALTGSTGSFCTATPVTPTVIITAAHCTDAFAEVGWNVQFARWNPDGSGPVHAVAATSRVTHPQWDPNPWGGGFVNDIALVLLEDPINVELFPELHRSQLSGGDIGASLKVVGYGVNNPPYDGGGTKRSIDMSITEVHNEYFVMRLSESWRGVCYGDSGGPSFVLRDHRNTQWGVHARTQVESCGPGEDTSVGFYYDSFVRSAVLSMDPDANTCGDDICTGIEREAQCPEDCAPYECGDSMIEGPEACDDGNTDGGDGCSSDCLSDETCGNGMEDGPAGEACDDGNTEGGDGCSADCLSDESCGNGITDDLAGEVCDDSNTTGGDGCSADCLSDESCGNGIEDGAVGEVCDDSNTNSGDGCSDDCRSDESCGNAIIDDAVGEVCDDENTESGDGCSGDCRIAEGCGNGQLEVDFGERCDDGNEISGDGCSSNCRSDETCGNGFLDEALGETCDDGNNLEGDACPEDCGVPVYEGLPGMQGGCRCHVAPPPTASSRSLVIGAIRALMSW